MSVSYAVLLAIAQIMIHAEVCGQFGSVVPQLALDQIKGSIDLIISEMPVCMELDKLSSAVETALALKTVFSICALYDLAAAYTEHLKGDKEKEEKDADVDEFKLL